MIGAERELVLGAVGNLHEADPFEPEPEVGDETGAEVLVEEVFVDELLVEEDLVEVGTAVFCTAEVFPASARDLLNFL